MATKATAKKRVRFLRALENGATVTEAAESAGVSRQHVYKWRKMDDQFRAAWGRCEDRGTDLLEDIAIQRAKEKSDTLLIFMLKTRRPDKYAEKRRIEHSGTVDHAHNGSVTLSDVDRWLGDIIGGRPGGVSEDSVH